MLADPTATDEAKRELVRTYNPPGYNDPWGTIQDYEHVISYSADHPNKGSQAVSSAVNLPRGRIRPWLEDGSQPDCYRGLRIALNNDWIIEDWSQDVARALNCLAGWILSSGSINDHWVPLFVTQDDRDEIEALRTYARILGVRLERTRTDDEDRPIEWRPTGDASVLGRVLHTWTDIRGYKNEPSAQFLAYLTYAPHHIAQDFCQVYIQQRSTDTHHSPNFLQITAQRSDRFRESLIECLQRVAEGHDLVRGDEWPIRLFEPAAGKLSHYPELQADPDGA